MEAIQNDHRTNVRNQLQRLLDDERAFDLVSAALWIAAEEYSDLDVPTERERIRLICEEGANRVRTLDNPFARLDGLRNYLFEELGFRGNLEQYNDPKNSFLSDVIERRLGIPLTLSMLFIEQARCAGFEAVGIGLPGHFVASVSWQGRSILVDPFHGAAVITLEDCKQLVARSTGRGWLFRPDYLEGTPDKAMIARLLMNLKYAYLGRSDYARALAAVERLLMVSPEDAGEIRDRGLLQARLGRPAAAIQDLETYLANTPDAPDTKSVTGRLTWLRRRQSETN